MSTEQKRTYRFYVKPITPEANEAIAEWLNARAEAATTLEHTTIIVNDKLTEGVYEVTHRFVTELRRSAHKQAVRVYVQEGAGKIRSYVLYLSTAKRLARTKSVSKLKQQLAALRKG